MAYKAKLAAASGYASKYPIIDFVCDTADDIKNLPKFGIEGTQFLGDGEDYITNRPVYYGSSATVAKPFSGYTLFPNNEWVKTF